MYGTYLNVTYVLTCAGLCLHVSYKNRWLRIATELSAPGNIIDQPLDTGD